MSKLWLVRVYETGVGPLAQSMVFWAARTESSGDALEAVKAAMSEEERRHIFEIGVLMNDVVPAGMLGSLKPGQAIKLDDPVVA